MLHAMLNSTPLTKDDIMKIAPSVYGVTKSPARSDRYKVVEHNHYLDALQQAGFVPFFVAQRRVRQSADSGPEFAKHIIRLRKEGFIGDNIPEIVIINSHDGSTPCTIKMGVFRMVCSNGLMVGKDYRNASFRHSGADLSTRVMAAVESIYTDADRVLQSIETMRGINLDHGQSLEFAKKALDLKYMENGLYAPIEAKNLLERRRPLDMDFSLWTTLNVIQENLIRGGISGESITGRKVSTRPMTEVSKTADLNSKLWDLATEYV